jgi:hypothetical protein
LDQILLNCYESGRPIENFFQQFIPKPWKIYFLSFSFYRWVFSDN